MPQQFENPANPEAHYNSTAPEIWEALDGGLDVFVAGVGTGGTVTGGGRFFKERNESVEIIAVEPETKTWLPTFTAREKPKAGSNGAPEEIFFRVAIPYSFHHIDRDAKAHGVCIYHSGCLSIKHLLKSVRILAENKFRVKTRFFTKSYA